MVKTYPRYEPDQTIGLISSSKSNIISTKDGKFIFTGALEFVYKWNIRQDRLVAKFFDSPSQAAPNEPQPKAYEVTFIQLSPNERQLAVGYSNGSVKIFDTETTDLLVHLVGHDAAITCLRFDPLSGIRLVSCSRDNDLVVWDVSSESGECRLKGHSDVVNDCLFLGENYIVSASKDSLVKIWNISLQHCLETLVGQKNEIISLSLNVAGDRLALLTSDQEVRICGVNVENLGKQLEDESFKVLVPLFSFNRIGIERPGSILYHPRKNVLLVQNNDKSMEVYKVRSLEELKRKEARKKKKQESLLPSDEITLVKTVKASAKIRSFALLPESFSVGVGSEGCNLVCGLANNSWEILSLDVSQSQTTNDKIIKTNELSGHRTAPKGVVISHNQDLICTHSQDLIKFWNLNTGNLVRTIECKQVNCTQFIPNDRELLVGTKTGELEIYDIASGTLLESVRAHNGPINSIALHPDREGFSTGGSDKELKIWEFVQAEAENSNDLPNTANTSTLKHFSFALKETLSLSEEILCIKWSPNSKYIAISLMDFTVKVFFADSLKFYLSLYGHKLPCLSIDISFDSKFLISASSDKNIKIWGLDFGDCHKSIFAHQDAVTSVTFLGEGTKLFASCGKDKLVKLWDSEKFCQIGKLQGHQDEVWGLACTQSGDCLVSISNDKSIRKWIKTDEPVFLEEERERELEEAYDQQLRLDESGGKAAAISAEKITLISIKNCDKLIEAIEAAHKEESIWACYQEEKANDANFVELPPANPLFQDSKGKRIQPAVYLLKIFEKVPNSELASVLLVFPFSIVVSLLKFVELWLIQELNPYLALNVLNALARVHTATISSTKGTRSMLENISKLAKNSIAKMQDIYLFNNAALNFMKHEWEVKHFTKFFDEQRIQELQHRKAKKIVRKLDYHHHQQQQQQQQ